LTGLAGQGQSNKDNKDRWTIYNRYRIYYKSGGKGCWEP